MQVPNFVRKVLDQAVGGGAPPVRPHPEPVGDPRPAPLEAVSSGVARGTSLPRPLVTTFSVLGDYETQADASLAGSDTF